MYYLTKCEYVKGKSGYKICRFTLVSQFIYEDLVAKINIHTEQNFPLPTRKEFTSYKIQRNPKNSEHVKKIYDYRCQVCGVNLDSPMGAIADGAHIKPLGRPHNGPDVMENMLCLCPNHHKQFDSLSFYIQPSTYEIVGLADFKNQKLTVDNAHRINDEFLLYHKNLLNGR